MRRGHFTWFWHQWDYPQQSYTRPHITQKFQNVKNALGEAFATSLESAKWKLWHGNAADALTKLAVLRDNVSDEGQRSKLTGLYEYLHRNQAYLVNYDARDQANQTYTSQVAESHIDTLINARHKRTKKDAMDPRRGAPCLTNQSVDGE